MSASGTLVEDKICRFKGECAHFSFNKCPSYTHDGANAKFSTNSHETDYSVGFVIIEQFKLSGLLYVTLGNVESD